jgi:hypothetical protein
VDYLHSAYPNARIFVIGVLPYAGCVPALCPTLVEPGPRAEAYNTALQAACASRSWLTCILPYANFEEPGTPDHLKASLACDDDNLHLENAGSALLANLVYTSATW